MILICPCFLDYSRLITWQKHEWTKNNVLCQMERANLAADQLFMAAMSRYFEETVSDKRDKEAQILGKNYISEERRVSDIPHSSKRASSSRQKIILCCLTFWFEINLHTKHYIASWDWLRSSQLPQSSELASIKNFSIDWDRPGRPDRSHFYPNDCNRLSRVDRLWSSAIVHKVFPYNHLDRLSTISDDQSDWDDRNDHMEQYLQS